MTTTWTRDGYNNAWSSEQGDLQLVLTMEHDSCHGAPWQEEDGHGPVSDWTRRTKEPGEIVLSEARGSYRYYDFAEACRIARKDGWGVKGGRREGESLRAYAARAARADFDHLHAWANDEWSYQVLRLAAFKDGIELGTAYLGGVAFDPCSDDDEKYVLSTAEDMIDEAISEAREQLERLCDCD